MEILFSSGICRFAFSGDLLVDLSATAAKSEYGALYEEFIEKQYSTMKDFHADFAQKRNSAWMEQIRRGSGTIQSSETGQNAVGIQNPPGPERR